MDYEKKKRIRKEKDTNRLREAALEVQGTYANPADVPTKAIALLERLPKEEQPAYRLDVDIKSLSLTELLAVQIGGSRQLETAQEVVAKFGNELSRTKTTDLQSVNGLGPNKSRQILAGIETGLRLGAPQFMDRQHIRSPKDAASLLLYEMSKFEQEHMRVILLDARCQLIKIHEVYKGSLTTIGIRPGEVLREAVIANAHSVIVVHNHPSRDPSPSPADVTVNKKIVEAGRLLDIQVMDHLIIGGGRYASLRELGLWECEAKE